MSMAKPVGSRLLTPQKSRDINETDLLKIQKSRHVETMSWAKKHFLALLGALLLTWQVVKAVVTVGGSVDFVVSRSENPGWVGVVLGILLNPPSWSVLPVVVAGLILIYWDARRTRSSPPREMAKAQSSRQIAEEPLGASTPPIVKQVVPFAEQVVPPKVVSSPPAEEPNERVFVAPEVTPERLMGFFDGMTAIQADKIVRPYVGKWIKVSGKISQISPFSGRHSMVTFSTRRSPFMYFYAEDEVNRLTLLNFGDSITVVGKISAIKPSYIDMDDCEIFGEPSSAS